MPNQTTSAQEDDNNFFPVSDIVREARAGLKGETAEEVFAALNSCEAASDHHRQLIINACGTHLLNTCHEYYNYITSKLNVHLIQSLFTATGYIDREVVLI